MIFAYARRYSGHVTARSPARQLSSGHGHFAVCHLTSSAPPPSRRSQDRTHQLRESGERQLGFGFDAGRPQDKMPAFLAATGRRLEQN
jgi:hypothetical protein